MRIRAASVEEVLETFLDCEDSNFDFVNNLFVITDRVIVNPSKQKQLIANGQVKFIPPDLFSDGKYRMLFYLDIKGAGESMKMAFALTKEDMNRLLETDCFGIRSAKVKKFGRMKVNNFFYFRKPRDTNQQIISMLQVKEYVN
jgi:hypothetical protein